MHALDKRLWTDGRTNGLNTVAQALSEALIQCMCMITLNLKTKIHLKQVKLQYVIATCVKCTYHYDIQTQSCTPCGNNHKFAGNLFHIKDTDI